MNKALNIYNFNYIVANESKIQRYVQKLIIYSISMSMFFELITYTKRSLYVLLRKITLTIKYFIIPSYNLLQYVIYFYIFLLLKYKLHVS